MFYACGGGSGFCAETNFFIQFCFDWQERTVFLFFPDRISGNNCNPQIIHHTSFYRFYALYFHVGVKSNVFSGKVFIHV